MGLDEENPQRVIGALSYEAALRASDLHHDAVRIHRLNVTYFGTAGSVLLPLLAKAAIDARNGALGRKDLSFVFAAASVLSVAFYVLVAYVLRIRMGQATRQDISSIIALKDDAPPQIRIDVAKAIERSVIAEEAALRTNLYEFWVLVAVFVAAAGTWLLALFRVT